MATRPSPLRHSIADARFGKAESEPEADGVRWHAVRFSAEPPQGVKFLKSRYTTWNRVEYGIESFFVQEGRGRAYENAVRDRRLSAKVAVNAKGQAVLKELVIE